MMDHRETLIENVDQVAALRLDLLAASDRLRSDVLRAGPLMLDGQPNEQLASQLRGLAGICGDIERWTAEAVSVLDQINRVRGRLAAQGTAVPAMPDGLGPPIPSPPPPDQAVPLLESDMVRRLKAERDALRAELAERE